MIKSPFVCPNCGGDVPGKAPACPHCGSDENTGWSDQTYLDGIELDDVDFTEKLKREYGVNLDPPNIKNRIFGGAALVLILIFLKWFILRC